MTAWRSSAAISLAAIGERRDAIRLAAEELEQAHRWGTARAIGVALCALGIAHRHPDGVSLLEQAISTLQDASAPVEQTRALVELGAALRRRGTRGQAPEHLRQGSISPTATARSPSPTEPARNCSSRVRDPAGTRSMAATR